jgi:hypothetical protein
MAGKLIGASVALVLVTAVAGALAAVGAAGRDGATAGGSGPDHAALTAQRKPIRFEVSDLFIAIHATDGDAGLQMNLESEEWRRFTLRDPNGRTVMDVRGKGRLGGHGLTGITFESSDRPFGELSFRKFKARFPQGRYTFRGTTIEGRRLIGADGLTHRVPEAPVVLAPAEDAVLDPESVVVRWERVTRPRGIRIVHYRVLVTEEASDRELSVELPPGATSAAIPADFLERAGEYKVELLAREKSGNRTTTEVPFKSSG